MELINIFLDACIIIYWVEAAEPFYSKLAAQLRHVAEQYPEHMLTVSRLSLLECLVKPLREKDSKTLSLYQDFFESTELTIIEIDSAVVDIATKLRADFGVRTPDAIQAASCLSTGERHIFLTNDKRFDSVSQLNILLL